MIRATVNGFEFEGFVAADGVIEDLDVVGVADRVEAQAWLEDEAFGNERPAFAIAARFVGAGYEPEAVLDWAFREWEEEAAGAIARAHSEYEPEGDW